MDFFARLFDGSLMPHGHCLLWRADLLTLHVGGDLLTLIAYFTIPPALLVIRQKRTDLAFDKMFVLFAAFIFLCGISHLMGLINVWQGYYFIEGLTKMSTGLVSAFTAVMVWRLLPQVLAMPSMASLIMNSEVLSRSQEEVAAAEAELQELNRKIAEASAVLKSLDGGDQADAPETD